MAKWEEKRLSEVCSNIMYGYTESASFEVIGPKFLRITDIVPEYIDWENVPYCKITDLEYQKYKLNKGDIVIARTGATSGYNKIILNDIKAVFASYLIKFSVNHTHYNARFVNYALKTRAYKGFIENYISGAAQPGINATTLGKFTFPTPDLPTQKRIADILSAYDDLIENNNRRIALLEKAAQDLYKEWFVRFRFPGYEKTTFVNGIPEGWEVKRLGDVVTFKKGKNITKSEVAHGNIPVMAGGLDPSCYHNVANTSAPVVTISASGANAGFIKFNYQDIWASDCSFIDNKVKNIYFYYELLNSIRIIITNLQIGSAQPHVYPKDINKVKVIKPTEEVTNLSNEKFKAIHSQISILLSENQNLKKQRDLLLPRLMSGKLEV